MKALFLTSTFYESPFKLGDHHLAEQFAQEQWQVSYVSAPISPFHFLKGNLGVSKARFNNYRSGGFTYAKKSGEIWSYVPGTLLPPKDLPLLNSNFIYQHWTQFTIPSLKQILLQRGFSEVDLLYFSSPIFYPLLEKIPHKCSAFRIADQEAGYEHFSKIDGYQRAALARNVDLVIYSAKSMEDDIKQLQPKRSMFLSNGVQLDNFINKSPQLPIEYDLIGHPIVVYIGAMREWFDSDLINQVSFALPNVNFVLIGPNKAVSERLEKRNNLHLLGQKSYKDLPKFLYHADLGIIPFNRVKYPLLVNSINPLKLYEYAACGLPIVATIWDELETINPPAKLCEGPQEFISGIQQVIAEPRDRNAQIAFARQFDWRMLYDKLIKELSFH